MDKTTFETYYSDHSDRFTKEYLNITHKDLLNLLEEFNIARHTKTENTEMTNLQLYGCTNVMSAPDVKEHFKHLYGESGSPFGIKEIRDKRDKTVKDKYNVDNVFQLSSVKNQIKNTQNALYGGMGYLSTYQKDKFHMYAYDNLYFDSSWELALYIYAKDHDEEIVREPVILTYIYDGKEKVYKPDFLYKGKLIEIKGGNLFKNGKLYDPTHKFTQSRNDAKLKCLIENDVELLFEEDVKFAIDYCKSKFNNKRGKEWYKQFLTKNCKNSGSN